MVAPLLQDHLDLAKANPVIKSIIKEIEAEDFTEVLYQGDIIGYDNRAFSTRCVHFSQSSKLDAAFKKKSYGK